MTDAMSKNDQQYELAKEMAADIDRACSLVARIKERNCYLGDEWEELPERIIDEHVGDPLCIEVVASGDYADWAYGDRRNMSIDHIEVTLGTGGPARGIRFYSSDRAETWHQDWFTPRVLAPLDSESAEVLAMAWGLDEW